ncbi:MAG: CHAT domain-containing protein [Saprospiraceae bacterium]|nr:CHAT domain-containing protein [Saprospiraceae bacterium]
MRHLLFIILPCIAFINTGSTQTDRLQISKNVGRDSQFVVHLLKEAQERIRNKKYLEATVLSDSAYHFLDRMSLQNSSLMADVQFHQGLIYIKQKEWDKALSSLENCLALREEISSNPDSIAAITLIRIATVHELMGNPDKAIVYYDSALYRQIRTLGPVHPDIARSHYFIGAYYYWLRNYSKAVGHLESAIDMQSKIVSNKDSVTAEFALWAGRVNLQLNNYDRALDYLYKAQKEALGSLGEEHATTGEIYNLSGYGAEALGDTSTAIYYYTKALHIQSKVFGTEGLPLARTYNNLGILFMNQSKFDDALDCHQKALRIRQKHLDSNHALIGTTLNNIGAIYERTGMYPEALDFAQKSLFITLQRANDKGSLALRYYNIANIYLKLDQYAEVFSQAKQGLDILEYRSENISYSPDYAEHIILLLHLQGKALYNQFHFDRDAQKLLQSDELYRQAMAVNNELINQLTPELAIQQYRFSRQIYEDALRNDLAHYYITGNQRYLNKIFLRIEESKSRVLATQIKQDKTLLKLPAADSIVHEIQKVRKVITSHENAIWQKEEKGLPPDHLEILAHADSLLVLRKALAALIASLPEMSLLDLNSSDTIAETFLNNFRTNILANDQSFVEYLVSARGLYILVISSDTIAIYVHEDDYIEKLTPLISELNSCILWGQPGGNTHGTQQDAIHRMMDASKSLYDILIAPIESLLTNRVIISTDHLLGAIPFDALVKKLPTHPARFDGHQWLGNEKVISYAYSADILMEMSAFPVQHLPENTMLAMAPFYTQDTSLLKDLNSSFDISSRFFNSDTLIQLEGSGEEIYALSQIFEGPSLYGSDATKVKFLQHAKDYRIIHLSTHGEAGPELGEFGWLAFSNPEEGKPFEKVYIKDIQQMHIDAEMITLSACKTGAGQTMHGEALISLARAFTKAGATSLVSTLWPVSDVSTRDFMIEFYKSLAKGHPKDIALWHARQAFRSKHKRDGFAHPFFWAGIVAMGNMRPLTSTNN